MIGGIGRGIGRGNVGRGRRRMRSRRWGRRGRPDSHPMAAVVRQAIVIGGPAGEVGGNAGWAALLSARLHAMVVQKALVCHPVVQGELAARVHFRGLALHSETGIIVNSILLSVGAVVGLSISIIKGVPCLDVVLRIVGRFVVVASGSAAPDRICVVVGMICWCSCDW